MHINVYISAWFCVLCFPPLSLLLLRRSAIEEPETKIPSPMDNYVYNFCYYTVKCCQDLEACLVGFLVASFSFSLNATWPLVTRRASTGSWIVKTLSLLTLLPQQLLSTWRKRSKHKLEGWRKHKSDGWVPGSLKSYYLNGYTVTLITLAQLLQLQRTVRMTFVSLQWLGKWERHFKKEKEVTRRKRLLHLDKTKYHDFGKKRN